MRCNSLIEFNLKLIAFPHSPHSEMSAFNNSPNEQIPMFSRCTVVLSYHYRRDSIFNFLHNSCSHELSVSTCTKSKHTHKYKYIHTHCNIKHFFAFLRCTKYTRIKWIFEFTLLKYIFYKLTIGAPRMRYVVISWLWRNRANVKT